MNKEFKITVFDSTKKWTKRRPEEDPKEGKVNFTILKKKTIDTFCTWLEAGKISSYDELAVLGSHLYEVLFDEDSDRQFREEMCQVKGENDTDVLRLLLEFKEKAEDLAKLPWEYIYLPDRPLDDGGSGAFIAAKPGLILTRHVPKTNNLELVRSPKPLRILIVHSEPEIDTDGRAINKVEAKEVIKAIEDLKKGLPNLIETGKLLHPTKRSLTDEIKIFKPHVVHFIGHGRYIKERGELAFVKGEDHKTAAWITDTSLVDCFEGYQPRLVFLHACKGAYSKSYDTFKGLALRLVYSRIPAVVAMQYEVENEVASMFAKRFYQSLGEGKMIDEAVQDGRRELGMYLKEEESFSSRAFGSPVVYLQSGEGIIIAENKGNEVELPNLSVNRVQEVQCPYPGCQGTVRIDDAKCMFCGRKLALCPNGHIIAKDYGVCRKCDYEAKDTEEISTVAKASLGRTKQLSFDSSPTKLPNLKKTATAKAKG